MICYNGKYKFICIVVVIQILSFNLWSQTSSEGNLEEKTFTIGTQNLWHLMNNYMARKINFERRIELFTPDIVAFQEAWNWYRIKSLFKYFIKRTGYKKSFCKTAEYLLMDEGVATTSHFDLDNVCVKLPYSKLFSKRYMTISNVNVHGEEVVVINVHLSPWDGHEVHTQIEFIAKYIRNNFSNKKVIVLGDFNIDYSEPMFYSLENLGFKSVDLNEPPLCTFCIENPYTSINYSRRIDYIFYRPTDFQVKNFGIWGESLPISDHSGLWAEFSLSGKR